jgi:hypothetical protein
MSEEESVMALVKPNLGLQAGLMSLRFMGGNHEIQISSSSWSTNLSTLLTTIDGWK